MDGNFKVTINEYLPLRDVVFNNIRDAIIKGDLKPGERLLEKQLSEKIGVSRTPIREALRKLEIEGFVEMIPRKGAMVAVISEKDIQDVLEIRESLEALAARLACKNMSEEMLTQLKAAGASFETAARDKDIDAMAKADITFHELLFQATGNDRLVQLVNNLSEQIHRFRIVYLKDKNYRISIIEEHKALLEAIANKNTVHAVDIAANHIRNQKKAVMKSIRG